MKKIIHICLLLVIISFMVPCTLLAQSVAINTDSSKADQSAILDLKSTRKGMLVPRMTMVQRNGIGAPATGLLIYQTDNTAGYYYFDGIAWTALKSSSGGGGTDANWSANSTDIHNNNSGNVSIGTLNALSKLTVQTAGGNYGLTHTDGSIVLSTYLGGSTFGAWFGTRSNHSLFFYTNNSEPRMAIDAGGNVGVGTSGPLNKFQIGDASVSGTDFAIGGNGSWLAMKEFADHSEIAASSNLALFPTGNVGILNRTPANKLQIGSTGATGFIGNDFAIGNGNSATAFNQYDNYFQVASNNDFVFLPRANTGGGRVGINTSTPRAPLEVASYNTLNYSGGQGVAYYGWGGDGSGGPAAYFGGTNANLNTSIYASQCILALQFDAFSDARIKNIKAVSNSVEDLKILRALQITDYDFKDKVKYGTRSSKKVIAQQVEKVYPQVVSKHTDFVPNVYQLSTKVEKTASGYLLNFANKHNISSAAKRLQLVVKESGNVQVEIISIPSEYKVEIAANDLKAEDLFVYGEEVNDFRTVDYEGLTTLNISATQEISRLLTALKKTVAIQNKKIIVLEQTVAALRPKTVNRLSSAKISARKKGTIISSSSSL